VINENQHIPKFILRRLPEPADADQSWQLGMDAIERKDQQTALRMFGRVAETGEWHAHYILGYLKIKPLSAEPADIEAGVRHMEIVARENGPDANLFLAVALIATEKEIERKRAYSILSAMADKGDMAAKIFVGYLLMEGRVTIKDEAKAQQLWIEAANEQWVWPMQLLADAALRKRQILQYLRWKWRTFKTAGSLATKDPEDIRLMNAI
jgi:hypothetical protein